MKLIQSRDNPFFKGLKRLAESGRERRKTGHTLLDGVHLVESYEAERCDRISLMHAGKVLASDTPAGLCAARGQPNLEAAFISYLEEATGVEKAPVAVDPEKGAKIEVGRNRPESSTSAGKGPFPSGL